MNKLLEQMLGGQTLEQRLTEEGRALKKIGQTSHRGMVVVKRVAGFTKVGVVLANEKLANEKKDDSKPK